MAFPLRSSAFPGPTVRRLPSPSVQRSHSTTRAQAAAYKNLDDLKALLVRNISTMLTRTTTRRNEDPTLYLRRNEINATLVNRFADDEMIRVYRRFLRGPLTEACEARKGELGLTRGSRGFTPRPFSFDYHGQLHTVVLE
jgi:hypothetical protein